MSGAVGRRGAAYRRVLGYREPRLLLGAAFVSEIGDWLNIVALLVLATRFGDGALSVGVLLALRLVPRLLFQAPAGALVDRVPNRALLIQTQLAMAAIAGAFVLLDAIPSLWLLYVLVFALETANVVGLPAFRAFLAAVTPPEERAPATGLFYLAMTTARFGGPVVGAALLGPLGATAVFLVNAATFVVVAVAVGRLPDARRGDGPAGAKPAAAGPVGYRWLMRQRDLAWYAALQTALSLLIQATIALFVVRALSLGLDAEGVGYFYTAVAIGSIAGGLIAGTGRHDRAQALYLVAGSLGACALALAWFGAAMGIWAALIALVVAGFATDVGEVTAIAFFQQRLPDEVFGRFFSVFLLALGIGGVLGALGGPVLETLVGAGGALAMLAAPSIVCAGVLFAITRKRIQMSPVGDALTREPMASAD